MYEEHPSFRTPPPERRLWRYMDLAKYLALLDTSSLYLTRPDSFDDAVEGYHPEANAALRDELLARFGEDNDERRAAVELVASPSQILDLRERVGINCWHQSASESHALWSIYGGPLGVAVETTAGRLIEALTPEPAPVYVGMVRYVKYERVLIDFDQWAPFLCKRTSFAHEREVRILVDRDSDGSEPGVNIAVDLNKLIRAVYVNPRAPDWFREVVRRATERHDITAEVHQSSLAGAPAGLSLPDTDAKGRRESIAFRVAVLMGEDLAESWGELLTGYWEGQVAPNLATIARTGTDPGPMLESVVAMMEETIKVLRSAIGNNGT